MTALLFKLWETKAIPSSQGAGNPRERRSARYDLLHRLQLKWSGARRVREGCIRNGLPAGIKAEDGKVYLLTGKPGNPVNAELADYAAKIVTIRGKKSVRDGFAQLQVEEIRKF